MEILKVDGVTLPTPTSMEYKEADLQWDGYRDAAGYLHKTTVRWRVRSIKCKWEQNLNNADITLMRNAINGKEYFTLTYYSDTAGASGTMTAYAGDMDYQLVRATSNADAKWSDVTLDFIEQ